jgi:hypothetical protein
VRVLWLRAPFVLRRHPPVLVAVVALAALAAVAASSVPFVRAGVESESLKGQLRTMSPLAAGLEVISGGPVSRDRARRSAAARFVRRLPLLGAAVDSTLFDTSLPPNGRGVVVLARTGAIEHVPRLRGSGAGAWISESTAETSNVGPGGTLRFFSFNSRGATFMRVRVAGVYRDLDLDEGDPYWSNWLQDIRNPDPNDPPPPPFVLVPEQTLLRIAPTLSPLVENRFEFPIDPQHVTFTGAQALERRFARIEREAADGAPALRALGCGAPGTCHAGSSLDAALAIAANDVAAVAPTISLLSACGLAIAFGLCVATGIFVVRRRGDEAHVLFVRGERPAAFAVRTAVETVLPGAAGAAIGLGVALLALRSFAPSGTIGSDTIAAGIWRAVAAGGGSVALVAAGAAFAFPRRTGAALRRRRFVPWEIIPLAVSGAVLALVLSGHGLARDRNGFSHPRLPVFALPVLAATGVAGLAGRIGRRAVRGRGRHGPLQVFLATRRLAAARALLVAVVVAAAAAFGTFAYAATLSASQARSTAVKAFVANGSDVQGVIDPAETFTAPLAFPAVIVELDQEDAFLPSGAPVDVVAADPAALARTLRYGDWGGDPRPLLPRLERGHGSALAAIATPGAPPVAAIVDQGRRVPIDVVGHATVPGATAGRPALLVSRAALRRFARREGFLDPAPGATGLIWAKGPPALVERALLASNLAPGFMTTPSHILEDGSVRAAERSYRFVRAIGIAAGVLSLVALLLYLQARQRAQLIASALAQRMGLAPLADAAAVALEAAAIVAFAAIAGAAAAVAAALPVVGHVDALPLYAPPPLLVVPWTKLLLAVAVEVAAAACIGGGAALLARRADASEALRVA